MTTLTIAYLRVSTDKQADKGISLEAQEAKVKAYAELYDLTLVDIVVESGSAKNMKRDGLQRALSLLSNKKAEALLIVKLDRLTRSVKDLGELLDEYFVEGKAALMSVTEQIDTRSAGGRLVLNVLASVSQWEREIIGERTATAMQYKISKHEYIGGNVPFGNSLAENGVDLIENQQEQEIITEAKRLRKACPSLRAIASELTKLGYKTRKGTEFKPTQILRMLKAAI